MSEEEEGSLRLGLRLLSLRLGAALFASCAEVVDGEGRDIVAGAREAENLREEEELRVERVLP